MMIVPLDGELGSKPSHASYLHHRKVQKARFSGACVRESRNFAAKGDECSVDRDRWNGTGSDLAVTGPLDLNQLVETEVVGSPWGIVTAIPFVPRHVTRRRGYVFFRAWTSQNFFAFFAFFLHFGWLGRFKFPSEHSGKENLCCSSLPDRGKI